MLTKYHDGFRSSTVDLFDVFFNDGFFKQNLKYDRSDTIDEAGIKIEMPGVKQSDLELTVEGRILKVSAKSRHGKEYNYSYTLKQSVDESSITASLQDGLLEVTLPKKLESKARKIPIT